MEFRDLGRQDSWGAISALVVGFDGTGQSCADNLHHLGARVVVIDPLGSPERDAFAALLSTLGVDIRRGETWRTLGSHEHSFDMLVMSEDPGSIEILPELRRLFPDLLTISPLDLARQLAPDQVWLLVGGSESVEDPSVLIVDQAAGLMRANGTRVGVAMAQAQSALELVMEPEPYEALVIRVTPGEISRSGPLGPLASCVLEAVDGIGAVYTDVEVACVYDADKAETENLVREADVREGARAIGVTIGTPGVGMLGIVDDILCDRAFVENRQTSAAELAELHQLADQSPDFVRSLLASVALARAYGVAIAPIRAVISHNF